VRGLFRSRFRTAVTALSSVLAMTLFVCASVTSQGASASAISNKSNPESLFATAMDSHTATTTTTTTLSPTPLSITAGPSRGQCLLPGAFAATPGEPRLLYLQSMITSFDQLTGTNVTCVSAYLDNTTTWSQWVNPWVTNPYNGYSTWVAQDPQVRQLVLGVDLIPSNLSNAQSPRAWENACAVGRYNAYATALGRNLVAAGLQNSVIRLGPEMNGEWERDFIGSQLSEQKLWAKCFANEVTSLRRVKGENFLIDWNPNACAGNYPFVHYYPGNAYVDIIGLDLYDKGCLRPYTRLSFAQLAGEQLGLKDLEAFAADRKKPMSLPEWGLTALPSGDDPGYINGVGKAFTTGDFAFETYFDANEPVLRTLPLGPSTPLSLTAFHKWFGTS
jgi:Glycosyl hydrolase family 26